jgi:hypothetical protein
MLNTILIGWSSNNYPIFTKITFTIFLFLVLSILFNLLNNFANNKELLKPLSDEQESN